MLVRITALLILAALCSGCFLYEGPHGAITDEPLEYYRNIDGSYPDTWQGQDNSS